MRFLLTVATGFTLDTYTHAVQGLDEEAAAKISTALEGSLGASQGGSQDGNS